MTKEKFNKWKEDNSLFFQALKDRRDRLDEQVRDVARDVLICTQDQIDHRRLFAAGMAGVTTAYAELAEMNFEFYEALMGEDP